MTPYISEPDESEGRRQIGSTVVFVLLALLVTYLPAGPQQRIGTALRATVLRPFLVTQEALAASRVRAEESGTLQAQVDSLVTALMATTTLEEENRQLRGLLSLSSRLGSDYVAASVIRPGTPGSESMFLLDVGTSDGVQVNAPIISRLGLVGVVREAGFGTSIGMDWTHPDFRASAISQDGIASGMVQGRRGEVGEEVQLIFDGTRYHTRLVNGTNVVTSGLGGIFPRGIPVGRVGGLAEADAGWRKSYWLEPLVEPGSVTRVLVATGGAPDAGDLTHVWPEDSILSLEELRRLEQRREDSLRAVGDSLIMLREMLWPPQPTDSVAEPDTAMGGNGR